MSIVVIIDSMYSINIINSMTRMQKNSFQAESRAGESAKKEARADRNAVEWFKILVGQEDRIGVSERRKKWFGRAYLGVSASPWIGYFTVVFLNAAGVVHITDNDLKRFVSRLWDSITDPVLKAIIGIVLGAVALVLVPGFIGTGIWLGIFTLGVTLTLMLLWALLTGLFALAKISVTGAVVAAAISACLVYVGFRLFRKYAWPYVWKFIGPVAEAIYGMFFDWWLTPILKRRKEERIMDDVRKTRGRYEEAVSKLRSEVPEIADIPISIAPETWLANVAERFRQRQTTKTFAAQTEMLAQVKQFFGEWRAALDAEDELKRAKPTYLEKDEEADLRRMEREKRKLTLEREIGELRKGPEEPAKRKAVDSRSPEQRAFDEMEVWKKELGEAIARCNGDRECIAEAERIFEPRRQRILEGR
jgi:hypothetical protein